MRALGFLLFLPALAHDLYLLPRTFSVNPGESLVVAVNNGDAFPESEDAPVPARLRDAALYAGAKAYNITSLRVDGLSVLGDARIKDAGTLVLAIRTMPNSIELEAGKFHEYLKQEGLDAVIASREQNGQAAKPGKERYSKYAKSLIQSGPKPDEGHAKKIGFVLEIVPEKNPYTLRPGDALPVQVLLRGEPAPGVLVQLDSAGVGKPEHTAVGRTDAGGRIRVKLPTAARYRLQTIAMEPCVDRRAADWESYWASLTFELK